MINLYLKVTNDNKCKMSTFSFVKKNPSFYSWILKMFPIINASEREDIEMKVSSNFNTATQVWWNECLLSVAQIWMELKSHLIRLLKIVIQAEKYGSKYQNHILICFVLSKSLFFQLFRIWYVIIFPLWDRTCLYCSPWQKLKLMGTLGFSYI